MPTDLGQNQWALAKNQWEGSGSGDTGFWLRVLALGFQLQGAGSLGFSGSRVLSRVLV